MKKNIYFLLILLSSLTKAYSQDLDDMKIAANALTQAEQLYNQKEYDKALSKVLESERLAKSESTKTIELKAKINAAIEKRNRAREEERRREEILQRKIMYDSLINEAQQRLINGEVEYALLIVEEAKKFNKNGIEIQEITNKADNLKKIDIAKQQIKEAEMEESKGNLSEALMLYRQANRVLKLENLNSKIKSLESFYDANKIYYQNLDNAKKAYTLKQYENTLLWLEQAENFFELSDEYKNVKQNAYYYLFFNEAVALFNLNGYEKADSIFRVAATYSNSTEQKDEVEKYQSTIKAWRAYEKTVADARSAFDSGYYKTACLLFEEVAKINLLNPEDQEKRDFAKYEYESQNSSLLSLENSYYNQYKYYRKKKNTNKLWAWGLTGANAILISAAVVNLYEYSEQNVNFYKVDPKTGRAKYEEYDDAEIATFMVTTASITLINFFIIKRLFSKGANHKRMQNTNWWKYRETRSDRINLVYNPINTNHSLNFGKFGLVYKF